MHGWPFEFWDTEHGSSRAGAKLPPLFLCHWHAPEAQIHTEVPLHLTWHTTTKSLQKSTNNSSKPSDLITLQHSFVYLIFLILNQTETEWQLITVYPWANTKLDALQNASYFITALLLPRIIVLSQRFQISFVSMNIPVLSNPAPRGPPSSRM